MSTSSLEKQYYLRMKSARTDCREKYLFDCIGLRMPALFFAFVVVSFSGSVLRAGSEEKSTVSETPELVLQTGHTQTINRVVFAPNDRWIATGSSDNSIRIWETESGRELRALTGHSGSVRVLAVSSDGKNLVSGGNDRTIRVWDVGSGRQIQIFRSPKSNIESVAFSRDGTKVAAGGNENFLMVWDIHSGRPVSSFLKNENSVTAVAFSPDGQELVSAGSDGLIRIWQLGPASKPKIFRTNGEPKFLLTFSPDGNHLAIVGADRLIMIFRTDNWRKIAQFAGHSANVLEIKFINANEVVSADSTRRIEKWEAVSGMRLLPQPVLKADSDTPEAVSAALNSNGEIGAFGYGNRTTSIVSAATGEQIRQLASESIGFNSVSFSDDRRWLAAGSFDNTIKLWDLQAGESLPPLNGHTGYVRCVVFHPDNKRIISASIDHSIRVWNILGGDDPVVLQGHTGAVNSIAIGKSGQMLVSGSVDGTIRLWDMTAMKETRSSSEHKGEVTTVALSANERMVASGGVDRVVRIWNLDTGEKISLPPEHSDTVMSVAFSPDQQTLASAGADNRINIWDIPSRRLIATYIGDAGRFLSLSFSSDGKSLAVGSDDGGIGLWKVSNGTETRLTDRHYGPVNSTAFSKDARWLATASEDGSIMIFRSGTITKAATLVSLREDAGWLVVTPQGYFDGSPRAWKQLLWRFSGDTFNVSPIEVFFNEFYQPGLLAELLDGQTLPNKDNISTKDRRQPILEVTSASNSSNRKARIRIKISESRAGTDQASGSGAKDVRLFRNGSLVRTWNGDVLNGKEGVVFEDDIPIVYGENEFTAYAFNRDNVKSRDYSLDITGSERLKRKPNTYIIAIGVGEYQNPEFNLRNVQSDAIDFGETFKVKQTELPQNGRVEVHTLINQNATKANILGSLRRLSTRNGDSLTSATPETGPNLSEAQPEDSVIVYFSGHGFSKDNRFFMIPYDLGYKGSRSGISAKDLENIASSSISDLDLEDAFRQIDANNILLIIDACNSGQALESDEKRSGPMNSKGLAQFAYEKGMFVLTASQPDEDAYVSADRERSYLTFALIEEGLKNRRADDDPIDGQVLLREWFDYAKRRVPEMRIEEANRVDASESAKRLKEVRVAKVGIQRPRVFYRRQKETTQMVIARFASGR